MNDEVVCLALRRAHHAGRTGLFRTTAHAKRRMLERGVTWVDVATGLRSATDATAEAENKWRFTGGSDAHGDELTIVAVLNSGVLVVTVF